MADRRLGWSIDLNLHNKRTSKDQEGAFKLSDYGPETVEDIVSEFRDHPSHVPGVTLGDIFDASPPHLLMRAVMHQKVFETWYGGRTVLVGEACHKFVPTAGQSDICNIADCVTLVNLLHELKSNTLSDIQAMFETYRSERHPGLLVSLLRKITFKRGVDFMYCKMNDIAHARRLLVTFLAFPTPRGIFRRIDPTPSSRTLDHLPVFNSYEATKAYLAKANQAIQNQQAASDEARRTLELQNEESRLYHYHHSYRQPFTSGSILSGSASGSSHLDEQSPSYAGEYIDPYDASSSRSSSLSRERSGFGSQFSYSNKSDTL
ncbi:hypothetical protein BGZ73_005389 [Actinomortierella ambigua]|nr:hypothetical protein BGZ73_005389 [Actinomortierella ambigua]